MKNRVALVTGANSGFGKLITLKFARNGYKVYATTRSLEKEGVKEINEIVKNEKLDIEWLVFDVTDNASINESVKEIKRVDVLVNNAGYGAVGPIEGFTDVEFKKQLEVNLVGVHSLVLSLLDPLKNGENAKIINITSLAGRVAYSGYGLYSASKFGLRAYSHVLRQELAKYRIDVAIVEPGTFQTDFGKNIYKGDSNLENPSKLTESVKKFRRILTGFRESGDPQIVADLIFNLSLKKRMRFRNLVGLDAKLTSFYEKWLPNIVWDFILDKIAKW